MKKRLHKAMPHVPLLKLNPGLAEQIKNDHKAETTEDTQNDDVVNGQGDAELNVNDNTACEHDSNVFRFNCCLCAKKMIFCRTESDNDEIPLVEMN